MGFALHSQLDKDCITLGDLEICRVLLMNNSHFPWLILVPMRENVHEIFELTVEDYQKVMNEIRDVSAQCAAFTRADKMNVATLGNQVPQLHFHIIARFKTDAAWPSAIWNAELKPAPYSPAEKERYYSKIRAHLHIA